MTHYQLFEVTSKEDEFVMIAPLRVISQYLRLHREAEKRIIAETKNEGECELHSGSRESGTHRVHKVIVVPNEPIVHRPKGKRPYFTLVEFRDGSWCIEFGDYERDVVEEELMELHCGDGVKKKNLKIIRTEDATQTAIDNAVAKINADQKAKEKKVMDDINAVAIRQFHVWEQEPSPADSKGLHSGWWWSVGFGPHGPFYSEDECYADAADHGHVRTKEGA